ncbi:MAG: DsbA family protein [Candidatus Omnitrophica bacterium]|nr:DsbA family protein [Candidatus Omnitrophota bacterium]
MSQSGSKQKIYFTLAVVLVMVALIFFIHTLKGLKKNDFGVTSPQQYPRTKGPSQAAVKIEEFTDFLCPACAVGSRVLNEYMKKYPDDMRLVYHYYPLYPNSLPSAVYAECAGAQGKFWEYHDRLISQVKTIHRAKGDAVFRYLLKIAEDIDLDMEQIRQCVADPKVEKVIIKEKELGNNMGVRATPTYFINGKRVVGHIALKEEFKKYFKESASAAQEIPKGSQAN